MHFPKQIAKLSKLGGGNKEELVSFGKENNCNNNNNDLDIINIEVQTF